MGTVLLATDTVLSITEAVLLLAGKLYHLSRRKVLTSCGTSTTDAGTVPETLSAAGLFLLAKK
jgi:hypothetical protein